MIDNNNYINPVETRDFYQTAIKCKIFSKFIFLIKLASEFISELTSAEDL